MQMELSDYIVRLIEAVREERGISVAELARRSGIDKKRLWRILNNHRTLHADELVRLCAVMSLDMRHLLPSELRTDFETARHRFFEDFGGGR